MDSDDSTSPERFALQLPVGYKLGSYQIRSADPTQLTGIARPVGSGGTSEVYLADQNLDVATIPRAVKYFNPTPAVASRMLAAPSNDPMAQFATEIQSMAKFSHQNLVKIIDAGVDHPPPTNQPTRYIVMEYVPPPTLRNLLSATARAAPPELIPRVKDDPALLLNLLQQLCAPLSYLHTQHFYHMDVAPKNIFIANVHTIPHVTLGDVGVGRTLGPWGPKAPAPESTELFIAGTAQYTPHFLHEYLNTKPIKLCLLAEYLPYWDIYAIGVIIEEICQAWELNNLRAFREMQLLGLRLQEYGQFDNMSLVEEELRLLLPTQLITAEVPELSQRPHGDQIGSIPIPFGTVPYSHRIRQIIDHPLFARLRLVPQLMLVHSVHPGGVHTRFEHALGTYQIGRQYLVHLLSNARFRIDFRRRQLEEALLAILLAELPAFPLDHALFEVLGPNPPVAISREARVADLLALTEVPFATANQSLRRLLEQTFPLVDIDRLVAIIGRAEHLNDYYATVIGSIIKSSIDVRVVDYLRRDSFHTGIPAGNSIDVDNIISHLALIHDHGRIGITQSGIHSVENLACARYWMFSRVYWNSINRSLTAMLKYSIYAMVVVGKMSPVEFVHQIWFMDESQVLSHLSQLWPRAAVEPYLSNPIIDFLRGPRPRPYDVVFEATRGSDYEIVLRRLSTMSYQDIETLRLQLISSCSKTLQADFDASTLLIDLPAQSDLKLGDDIYVLMGNGSVMPLSSVSRIIETLPRAFETSVQKLRVFGSPALRETFSRADTRLRRAIEKELMSLVR